MITKVTKKEQQLANILRTTTEALQAVTAERDRLSAELASLWDSGVELPFITMCLADYQGNLVDYFTEAQLRDYGDRRAMAERERCISVIKATWLNQSAKDDLAEAIRKGEQ